MNAAELLAHPGLLGAATLLLIAAAAGVSLYATLGALGLASRLNEIPALPPGLTGLENGLVIATAAALLVVEALADREPAFAGMWHSLHALVKPLAATLLTASALATAPPATIAGACLLAGSTALLFHAIRYGARVAWRMPDAPRGSSLLTAGEALLALGLLLPVRFQEAALLTAGGALLAGLVAGPLGFRAFRLGVSAQRARLRAFLGETGWDGPRRLPGAVRRLLPPTPLGGTPPRVARVGTLRAPGLGRFRRSWLVSEATVCRLLARTWLGVRQIEVPRGAAARVEPGTWADVVEIDLPDEKLRILLLKDGPAPVLVARAFAQEPDVKSRVNSPEA